MRLARVALLLSSLAIVVGVAEGVVRLAGLPTQAAPRPSASEELPRLSWFDLARRKVRGLYNGALYETNDAGFRGPERTRIPARDTFRIALIGDSIAMGSGVPYDESYAALVEAHLRPSLWRRVEVLDFALAGLNAQDVVERFALLGPPFHPDLVVYGYTLNDLEGPDYRARVSREPPTWPLPPGPWESHLWAYLEPRIASLREAIAPPADSYVAELDDNYFENPEAVGWLERQLDWLAREAEKLGVCVVVLVHPRLSMLHALHPFARHYARIEELARARGFTVVQGYPAVRGESAEGLWVSPHDKHPNARGHALLADRLEEALRELPTSCWERARPGRRAPAARATAR